jgi:hypothetical protein
MAVHVGFGRAGMLREPARDFWCSLNGRKPQNNAEAETEMFGLLVIRGYRPPDCRCVNPGLVDDGEGESPLRH